MKEPAAMMPAVIPDLSSVSAKLRRAKEHFDAVNAIVAARLDSSDYSVSKITDVHATEHAWIFHAPKGTDFTDLSLSAGDCIHNLRSALDHLIYAIAVHESGQDPPPEAKRLAFPIASDARHFGHSKTRIASLSPKVRAAIESVQPYNRPHPQLPPLLGLLAELDDIDKHRLLQVAIGVFHRASFGYDNLPPGTPMQIAINKRPLKDGSMIVAFKFDTPKPDMKLTFDGDFMLAISHRPGPSNSRGTEVRTLLAALWDEVEAVTKDVLGALGA